MYIYYILIAQCLLSDPDWISLTLFSFSLHTLDQPLHLDVLTHGCLLAHPREAYAEGWRWQRRRVCNLAGFRVNTHWAIICSLLCFALALYHGPAVYDHEGTDLSVSHPQKCPMEMTIFPCISLVHGWSSVGAYTTPGTKDNCNGANIPTLWEGTCGFHRNTMTWRLLSPQNDAAWNAFKALHAKSITEQMA